MKLLKDSQIKVNEDYITQKCYELLKDAEVDDAPVDPRILASFRGINNVSESDMSEAGILLPASDGNFKILLRKSDNQNRKRFTCCHEIVHTFMPDYQLKPQKRVDGETGGYDKKDFTEYLCDHGAAELLLPSFIFEKKFSQLSFNIDSLLELSDVFQASLEATAIKMVKNNPQRCALVIWEENYKPSEIGRVLAQALPGFENNKPKKKLRIQLGFGFDNFIHIPKHKSLDEDGGIINSSYNSNTRLDGKEVLDFGEISVECNVFALPLSNTNKILTLLERT